MTTCPARPRQAPAAATRRQRSIPASATSVHQAAKAMAVTSVGCGATRIGMAGVNRNGLAMVRTAPAASKMGPAMARTAAVSRWSGCRSIPASRSPTPDTIRLTASPGSGQRWPDADLASATPSMSSPLAAR